MTASAWVLQQALFAHLSGDAGLAALLGDPPRIYDAPPGDAPLPYLVLGAASEKDWGTATDSGSDHLLTFEVWSRGGGHRQAKLIASAVRAALDDAALDLPGLVLLRFVDSQNSRQPDGITWRAALRFRALIEHQE